MTSVMVPSTANSVKMATRSGSSSRNESPRTRSRSDRRRVNSAMMRGSRTRAFRMRLVVRAAPGPLVRHQHALAQADVLRRHFDELVVVDELDGLLEPQLARRDQPHRLVGRGGAHVGLLLFL